MSIHYCTVCSDRVDPVAARSCPDCAGTVACGPDHLADHRAEVHPEPVATTVELTGWPVGAELSAPLLTVEQHIRLEVMRLLVRHADRWDLDLLEDAIPRLARVITGDEPLPMPIGGQS